jgi:hypothetical protein
MMKKIGYLCLIPVVALSFCVAFPLYGQEKKETDEDYTIKKGDTLWDISSRFLKNPYLWPKLWQKNPYITNPHWIYPGNPIRLNPPEASKREEPKKVAMETKPTVAKAVETKPMEVATESEVKKAEPPREIKKPEEVAPARKESEEKMVFPEIRFAGFFSDIDFRGIGDVLDSREGKTLMAEGDICYVGFRIKDPVSIGKRFTTFSSTHDNIMMDTRHGKRYNITGIIQIIDQYGDFYTARVLESFQEINRGDHIMPYNREKMEGGISAK